MRDTADIQGGNRANATPVDQPRSGHADWGKPAIRLRGITKTFGRGGAAVQALRGINLDVAPGQLLMLVGPSGCGKTTLVSIISGVLDADEGDTEVFGVRWGALRPDAKTRRRGELVGFIFQQFNLIPTLSVVQNAAIPLLLRNMRRADALDLAGQMLAKLGLGDRLRDSPMQLSGGMQQRVAIARALVGKPRLLICDEPTASLDARTGQSVMDLIQAASRERDERGARVVVVVTHDTRVFHYADHVEEMEDGRLKDKPSATVLEQAHHAPEPAGAGAPAAPDSPDELTD